MNGRHPQQNPSQQAVRVGHFERAMNGFNEEIGQKTATLLQVFYVREIQPILERVTALETELAWLKAPWYRRLWYRVCSLVEAFLPKREPPPEPDPPPPAAAQREAA